VERAAADEVVGAVGFQLHALGADQGGQIDFIFDSFQLGLGYAGHGVLSAGSPKKLSRGSCYFLD
jgi:hypothetical protein